MGGHLDKRGGQNKEFHLNLISYYQQKSGKMPRMKALEPCDDIKTQLKGCRKTVP